MLIIFKYREVYIVCFVVKCHLLVYVWTEIKTECSMIITKNLVLLQDKPVVDHCLSDYIVIYRNGYIHLIPII